MRFKCFTTLLCLSLLASPAVSQSYWSNAGQNHLSFEAVHPSMTFPLADASWTTGSLTLFGSGSYNVMDNLAVAFELPYVRAQLDVSEAESSSSIGNPYVGVEFGIPQYGLVLTGGARVALAKADLDQAVGQIYGIMSSIDRMEAFLPETSTLLASARYTRELAPNIHMSARFGVNMALYSDTEEGEDSSDAFTLYGAQGWYQTGAIRAGGGFLGRLLLTGEDEASFSDNSMHEAGLWADYAFGPARAGLFFRIPLDEATSDIVDYTVGVSVSYRLPR